VGAEGAMQGLFKLDDLCRPCSRSCLKSRHAHAP
jgi:hypothetical protein